MKNRELRESKDGRCPYCNSDNVVKTSGFGGFISADKLEEERIITYKCYKCNKEFCVK
ncbi:MAG: hypothetical protein GQ544_08255 [Candidatus Aminicenantes bacterium]|nr:hypothetical protein [Candidatus Aminicenantes bacterium]